MSIEPQPSQFSVRRVGDKVYLSPRQASSGRVEHELPLEAARDLMLALRDVLALKR